MLSQLILLKKKYIIWMIKFKCLFFLTLVRKISFDYFIVHDWNLWQIKNIEA